MYFESVLIRYLITEFEIASHPGAFEFDVYLIASYSSLSPTSLRFPFGTISRSFKHDLSISGTK